MEQQGGLKQPMLGVLGMIICFFISFGIINWWKTETFLGWASYLIMCAIPIQIIIGLAWQANYPPPAAKLEQPLKGFYLLFIIMFIGALVAAWANKTVGGFLSPPTPFVIFFTICAVVTTISMVILWQCWPAAAIYPHPAFVGFGTLIIAYILNWILFRSFFDFGFMKGAPFYVAALDPGGAFNAWTALSFVITFVMVELGMVLFDFWPLSAIPPKAPAMGKQPLWGIVATIWCLILSYIIRSIFVTGMGYDPVIYMVRICICMVFGIFIMMLLFQTWPVQTMKQPAKGIICNILAVVLGIVMYHLYSWFGGLIAGALPAGPPGYVSDLWLANALLGVTFPVIVAYTGFFNFWPLTEAASGKK